MGFINEYIEDIKSSIRKTETSKDLTKLWEVYDTPQKAIYILTQRNDELYTKLRLAKNRLKEISKYDARNMSLIQFIKMKVGKNV